MFGVVTFIKRLLRFLGRQSPTESKKFDRIFRSLRQTDIAVDCGANVGKFTEIMAKRGATVYAFEPNPDAFAELSRRMDHFPNVTCLNKAVSVEVGTVRLFLHQRAKEDPVYWSTGSSLLAEKGNVDSENYVDVEAIDLVAFLDDLPAMPKLLKMDIEGAETTVLRKLIESGQASRIGHVLVEAHDHKIPSLKPATDYLRSLLRDQGLQNVSLDWI